MVIPAFEGEPSAGEKIAEQTDGLIEARPPFLKWNPREHIVLGR
jgi:hypothetical protein